MKNQLYTVLLATLIAPAFAAPPRVCANSDEAARIAPLLAKDPVGPVSSAMIGQQLGLNEALVVSSYGRDKAIGVGAENFAAIWKNLNGWDKAMVLITKGGNVFEVSTKIVTGKPSERSKYFNLEYQGPGLAGHLRPDLLSAIYALALPTKEGMARGLMFFGEQGESVFGVFVPGEGGKPTARQLADFDATWALLKSLPAICAS
jgi:putative heme iron utilization protein